MRQAVQKRRPQQFALAFKETGKPIRSYARHYYRAIKADYDRISAKDVPKSYVRPVDMNSTKSDPKFPPEHPWAGLGSEFEAQCE